LWPWGPPSSNAGRPGFNGPGSFSSSTSRRRSEPGFRREKKRSTPSEIARIGLTVTLFLIGCGISKKTLRIVGARPLAQGVILWVIVGALSLALIQAGLIGL
ncbi:MAG: hypothetical protein J2P21_09715, partial [Chloracidobacterium sp.]|nr:hypothetical protein [Chloracidobacterium sp.]